MALPLFDTRATTTTSTAQVSASSVTRPVARTYSSNTTTIEGGRTLSPYGAVFAEPRTNQLFVTDIPSKLDEIRKLIAKTDIATKQVLIEARIVEAEARIEEVLARVGLTTVAERRAGAYSRGMRQRLGLAVAGRRQLDRCRRPRLVDQVVREP